MSGRSGRPLTEEELRALSALTLPILSPAGGTWGQIRVRPSNLERVIHIELRPSGEEGWKPFCTLLEVDGKIAFKMDAEQRKEVAVYDGTTGTFSYVERSHRVQ